jgi:4-alpha-glucanotransferase
MTSPLFGRGTSLPDRPLDVLAEKMGILPEFRDARGNRVRTSEATQRGLLNAMGIEAADDAQVIRSLELLERDRWQRSLPSIQVAKADQEAAAVEVVLPADSEVLRWTLTLESGAALSGDVEFPQLPLLETKDFQGRRLERRRLVIGTGLPWGYHVLQVEPGSAQTTLVITPGQCWLPAAFERGARLWGLAVQLYLVRSSSNWGIGDFSDLRQLVSLGASRGADVIGLNPLHALFADDPEHASPYSPASRLLLNVLNVDVMAVPELQGCARALELIESADFQRRVESCRAQRRVDYAAVAELKREALQLIFEACRGATDASRWQAFHDWRKERGEILEKSCLFLALREQFSRVDNRADWRAWPPEFRNASSIEVQQFAREHSDRIELIAWQQWIAETQLAAAEREARGRNMQIGLYRDLAVGADPSGAETWINPSAVITGAQVGAPPDIHNPAGQNWGLPPFNPRALQAEGYRSFIELIRANMRCAGGLRIDHVMALQQLYWVAQVGQPEAGAYVRYPLQDLVGILALESHRHHCLVVGEDLGTVPENFREHMAEANILSYRVLLFEQNDKTGEFIPPGEYPSLALAVTGSHDLPTLRGWWAGEDIDLKARLGLFPEAGEAERQHAARRREQAALLEALRREGLLPADGQPHFSAIVRAVHAFLARSKSALVMAQLDDLTNEIEQVNVPATSDEHPNWRRRHSLTLHELERSGRFADIAAIFIAERSPS